MRCHYLSDLHLESQGFNWRLPKGDVLIIAGDLCHASCLDPARTDRYSVDQRSRVYRFVDAALASFKDVLLVPGNHDHYDGIFDDTAGLLARYLPGVTVLDNRHVEIGGVRFFGTTLWSDFEGRSADCMDAVKRRVGDLFFVKKRDLDADGKEILRKFAPRDALAAFDASVTALRACHSSAEGRQMIVISHHPPTRKGLNPRHSGNGLDGLYASDLDEALEGWEGVSHWVHGHTHIRRTYRVGNTVLMANCRGFEGKDACARTFAGAARFET
ncbi:MAG: metallophosphoesterase [Hyphomicrobiaceae bacterium]